MTAFHHDTGQWYMISVPPLGERLDDKGVGTLTKSKVSSFVCPLFTDYSVNVPPDFSDTGLISDTATW